MQIKDEWTQEEFLRAQKELQGTERKVLLVDTILSPIEKMEVVTYNPYELEKYPEGSIFVFYCDTGKVTKERLGEFKRRFPKHHCISLKGGKGYWRKNMQILESDAK